MKKILFILLFPVVCFAQSKFIDIWEFNYSDGNIYQGQTISFATVLPDTCCNSTYKKTDTLRIYLNTVLQDGSNENNLTEIYKTSFNDAILLPRRASKDNPNQKVTDVYFKIPSNFIIGKTQMTINYANQREYFFIQIPNAVLNPFLPENKDTEFDFYSQSGIFQKHCKVSELNPGLYIANGFKISIDSQK